MTSSGALPGLDSPGRIAGTVLAGMVIEAAMAWRFGWSPPLAAYSFLALTGAVVSATDLAARRVPNPIVLPAYPITVALLVTACLPSGLWWPLARAAIAAAVLGGFYLALRLAFPAGVGLGDVKWAGVLGAYLGWLGWADLSSGTLVAFTAAAVFVAGHSLAGRHRHGSTVPMAPFMTAGALVAALAIR